MDSDDSDASLKLGPKQEDKKAWDKQGTSSEGEKTPCNQHPETRIKEVKVKRGSGTEKQKLRERIREMLLNSGWTIDYRPRRNRDYLDAVYINPTGTAYWSIIKAYDALLKQLDEVEARSRGDGSPFTPLSNDVLSQLTRKTKKKIEKELKRKKRDVSDSEDARETTVRKSSTRYDEESLDSGSREEKLSSFVKQAGKSLKSRTSGDGSVSINSISESSPHHLHDGTEKRSSGSNSLLGSRSRKLGRCMLLVRNSNEGTFLDGDGFVPYSGKRTLLSWLIDCGTVQLSEKVCYMNRRRTKVMLEGWLTRDGIHCGCCSKILTVSKFEIHAGSKLHQPFQNIYLDSGVSLLDCQIEAWNRQESVKRLGFQAVDIDGNDPNDDTCGLCGDGGDLMCCDGCPSTFHQSCLDIKMLPPGDWHCPNCTCKFCGIASDKNAQGDDTTVSKLLTYHRSCTQEFDSLSIDTNSPVARFCEKKCRELFEHLQKYLGVKHELDAGFSWSLIHRVDADSDTSLQGLPQRVECNSKLAVSLSVMDECFLPVVDRRSGINLIQNVLYNCGSNFNRLNFGGFYAVILERGDEIISAASIRFHGTWLAEMPFIGTRHMYRRQGMCRRLFYAIESTLCSLKVEKLIIPAISELMHTWTEVFGFTTLDELLKQELKSMNTLVFPGIDMLQKELRQENIDGKRSTSIGFGANQMEFKEDSECIKTVVNKYDADSPAGHDAHDCDDSGLECLIGKNEVASASSDSQCPDVSSNNVSTMNSSLDVSRGLLSAVPVKEETIQTNSKSEDKLVQSAVDKKSECVSYTTHDVPEMVKSKSDSPVEDTSLTCFTGDVAAMDTDTQLPGASLGDASMMSGSLDASCELKDVAPFDGTSSADSESEGKILGSASITILNVSGDSQEENKSEMASPAKDSDQSCKVDGINLFHSLNLNESVSGELKVSKSVEESGCADSQSEDKFVEITLKMEAMPLSDSSVENINVACNDGDLGDIPTGSVDMVSLEAVPSIEKTTEANFVEKVNEISGVSVSGFSGAKENNMQIESNPNSEIGHERGIKLDVVPEAVSDAMYCGGAASHVLEESSVIDAISADTISEDDFQDSVCTMASTKINFDTKELQFDLLMGLSGAISARRWRRIYCREMQAMVWRLVADMWRCSSVDDQQTKLPRFVLSLLIDSSALSGAGKIAREKKAAVIKRRRYKFRCLHVGDSLMKLRKGLETSGMDVVAVPRHLQSRTATPSLTKPRRSTIIFQRNLVVPTRIHYPCPHTFSSTPLLMDSHAAATTTTSKPLQAYRSSLTNSSSIESPASARIGEVKRVTNETNVSVKFNLDGTGIADSTTGIPFLDHMLDVSYLSFLPFFIWKFGFYYL
ncbi:hypothetical protein NC653_021404 [Populus alba x Populus x berolinensis]|uniref:PHD-type domain-containing protein n=1 Tax=Populus alba x Populus x berolinensis TaxID=444605 RepID=A0AAD6MMV7_9ROSI|nr:hypothetical protein NC653_021404 [Populus alba x Populus x berolinensis]